MSTAGASTWPCPQCRRRVPRREPVCHCGYARGTDSPAARPAGREVALPPEIPRAIVAAGIAVVAMVGVLVLAVVVQEIRRTGVEPVGGEVRYPALPMVPEKARPSPRRASRAITGPSVADVVEVSLRKIAADTSELELRYRPFAEACLAGAPDGGWLVALKKAPVRADVKVRDGGATVGCDVARWNLIARADVLKSDLAATESRARTDGLLPGRWRALLVKYELAGWERY